MACRPRSRSSASACVALAASAILAACSPPEPSTFGDAKPTPKEGLGSADAKSNAPLEFQECATKTATAESKPVYLVFMFDKSGSMVVKGSPKWAAAKAASKTFFAASDSRGVHASLAFFPNEESYSCSASVYSEPSVTMTSLPSTTFEDSLEDQAPAGGTPTAVALAGAIQYAQRVAANEGKDGTVAIVLVTDGLPDSNCDGDSIASVKSVAASVKDRLPTYVIGVGGELKSLREIAVGGGTKDAILVSSTEPAQLRVDFLAAINKIKASALACDYEIPSPPPGEKLDRDMVNVFYKADGTTSTIPYDATCGSGTGWRYDSETSPQRIVLCPASCDNVKSRPGQMNVLFGCATRRGAVN